MASGTITGSTNNEYIDSRIVWSSTATTSSNSSKVTASLQYKRNNTGFTTYGTGSFSITINGSKTSTSKVITITESEWVTAVSASTTVTHSSDGTKSITILGTGSISGTTLSSTSCSGTAKLDTIPRASTIDYLACSTKYFNGTLTYKYTPQSSSYYNRCNISLNLSGTYIAVKSINLGKKSAGQKTASVTLSADELSTIYNELPNTTKGTLRFTFRTYSDSGYSDQIGDAEYKEVTLYIPEISSTQPSVVMALSPVSSLSSTFSGLYIQGKTKVQASFTGTSAKYKAKISSYAMAVSGLATYGSPYQSDLLSKSGTITVKGTAKDSRGFSSSNSQSITVIAYSKPSVIPYTGEKAIICQRCTSDGTLNPSGTYLRIKVGRKYSKVTADGTQKNFCLLRYRYKTESATSFSSWATLLAKTATSNGVDVTLSNIVSSLTTSYVVQIGVTDDIGETPTPLEFTIPTAQVTFHLKKGGKGASFGKYAETDNCLEIAEDWDIKIYGDRWKSLGLSSSVTEGSNTGRNGSGCYYRVENGNHVYVAFNCAFTYSGSAVQVNANAIPAAYRPTRKAYAMNLVSGRAFARTGVNDSGNVVIDWVQLINSAETTGSASTTWIDGYIDYWI
jgi:hypothetical protein